MIIHDIILIYDPVAIEYVPIINCILDDLLSAKDRIMTANPNKQRNASRTDG